MQQLSQACIETWISRATHDFLHAYMMHLIQGGGLCHIEG